MSDQKVKLKVDDNICTQCGTCAMIYPDYFELNDDGSIDHDKALVPKEEAEDIKNICPVQAIEEEKIKQRENKK